MRKHQMTGRLFASLAAAALLAGVGMLATAIGASASPSLTVKGLNTGPRTGPDGGPLNECPLTVTYSGGASSGTVNVDVISVSPTTPTGKSVLVSGPKSVTLDPSGDGQVVFSSADFDFSGFVSTPPSDDNYKIQVVVTPGPTTLTFWVADCVPENAPKPPTTPTSSTSTTTTTTTTVKTGTETNVIPPTTTTTAAPGGNAVVLGQQIIASPAAAPAAAAPAVAVQGAQLARTGSNTTGWLISSIALLLIGAALTVFARVGRAAR
jgi:hypothetical protein